MASTEEEETREAVGEVGTFKMWRRLRAILWFSLSCGFLSLAFTRYYETAESLLSAVLIIGLLTLTIGKLHKLWMYRFDPQMFEAHARSSPSGIFDRFRRWAQDEQGECKR